MLSVVDITLVFDIVDLNSHRGNQRSRVRIPQYPSYILWCELCHNSIIFSMCNSLPSADPYDSKLLDSGEGLMIGLHTSVCTAALNRPCSDITSASFLKQQDCTSVLLCN